MVRGAGALLEAPPLRMRAEGHGMSDPRRTADANREVRPRRPLWTALMDWIRGEEIDPIERANRGWSWALGLSGASGVVLLAMVAGGPRDFASAVLIALATLLAGAFIGVLFGLPRLRPAAAPGGAAPLTVEAAAVEAMRANTNLEDVSDWVTKILIGVGLTQLEAIPGQFQRLVDTLKQAAAGTTEALVPAIVISYAVIGFLSGYLWARTRLGQAFKLAAFLNATRASDGGGSRPGGGTVPSGGNEE
jgi:hypothetical protein